MNVRKFKEEKVKIEEVVVTRKRIRTCGNLQEGDGKDNDKGTERKEEDKLITRVWFFHSTSLELCYHCTCAMTSSRN